MITDTHTSDVGAFKKTDFKSDHIQDLKITAFKKKVLPVKILDLRSSNLY